MEFSRNDLQVGRGVLVKYIDGKYYPANIMKVYDQEGKNETWVEVVFVGYKDAFAVELINLKHPASHFAEMFEHEPDKATPKKNDEESRPVVKRRKKEEGTWAQSSIGARARRFEKRKDKQEAHHSVL